MHTPKGTCNCSLALILFWRVSAKLECYGARRAKMNILWANEQSGGTQTKKRDRDTCEGDKKEANILECMFLMFLLAWWMKCVSKFFNLRYIAGNERKVKCKTPGTYSAPLTPEPYVIFLQVYQRKWI
mmetsp:Transcript_17850/g.26197  ORF Transcript_17850/g.26197 Transcript_17850/m.26197 type:complete len:128 (+) Transcript_17850:1457-1840(+)